MSHNEIEKLDLIISYLVKNKTRIGADEFKKILSIDISDQEAKYLCKKLIDDDVVEHVYAKFNAFIIKYSHNTQRFFDQGGYANHEEIKKADNLDKSTIKFLETEKLKNEVKLTKWQTSTFWWFFYIALIGGVLGIVSFFMQIFN